MAGSGAAWRRVILQWRPSERPPTPASALVHAPAAYRWKVMGKTKLMTTIGRDKRPKRVKCSHRYGA